MLLRIRPVVARKKLSTHRHYSQHHPLPSNWLTIEDQSISRQSLTDLLNNKIASIRVPQFLSPEDCGKLVDVVQTHKMGSYNDDVYPPIGAVGISQFDHQKDKEGYFKLVEHARSLQKRFVQETQIDILARVTDTLRKVSGMPVRIAREGDRDYFAGLLRMINSSALIHADYAPYDGPSWEIGRITGQLTWNILLRKVEGGESIVYDRFWLGQSDDQTYRKAPPSYGYSPIAVENRSFKVVQPKQGDLAFFNSRNFHEVKQIDRPKEESRFTMSSFVGYLEKDEGGPALILWS